MKSYRNCPRWRANGGMTSRKKAIKHGAAICEHAVNCRACRRCPYVPEKKLTLWAEEAESQYIKDWQDTGKEEPDHPELLEQTVKDNPIDPTIDEEK